MGTASLTEAARDTIQSAQQCASRAGNPQLEPLHLLRVLLQQANGASAMMLSRAGVSIDDLQNDIARELTILPRSRHPVQPLPSSSFLRTLDHAHEEAARTGNGQVAPEHLLLALAHAGISPRATELQRAGVGLDRLRASLQGIPDSLLAGARSRGR